MTCINITAAHDGRDVQPTTLLRPSGLPDYDRPLCAGCRERLESMGYQLRPGRVEPVREAWPRLRRPAA